MEKESPLPAPTTDILHVLKSAAVTVFSQDRDLRYRWLKNPPASWSRNDPVGKDDSAVLPPTAAAVATALKRDVLSTGRAQWGDIAVEANGSSNYFELFIEAQRNDAGMIIGVVGLAIDVTDRRKQAETLEAVARDLSHRSKNLLAIIQSLATQTAKNAPSTDAFIDQFRGRIQSISRSQDLSIGAKRHGAKLSELIETQVVPYVMGAPDRVTFKGLDCTLSPNAALHMGLALYELCIAAARFGSLSDDAGGVVITAALSEEADSDGSKPLSVTWHESGGPAASAIDGFGRVLLERVVPAAVGGNATLSDSGATRDYALTIAAREFAER